MSRKKINIRTKKLGMGPRLRRYRKAWALKVEELALVIGVAHGTISNIENEMTTISAETLQKLCQNTNINPVWLLTGNGPMVLEKRLNKPISFHIADQSKAKNCDRQPIETLLSKAQEILESDTSYAISLAANIESFHEAMETRCRLLELEKRVEQIENRELSAVSNGA